MLASVLICLATHDWHDDARFKAVWQMSENIQQDEIKSYVSKLLSEHAHERDKARDWFVSHPAMGRPALYEIIRAGKPVRLVKEAVSLLGKIGDEQDVSLLNGFLKKQTEVTWEAAQALAKHPSNTALNALLDALEHSDTQVVGAAAVALGVRGDESARKPLEKLLTNQDESVRYRAVFALQKLGAGPSADVLRRHRDQEKSEAVRELIDKALNESP